MRLNNEKEFVKKNGRKREKEGFEKDCRQPGGDQELGVASIILKVYRAR